MANNGETSLLYTVAHRFACLTRAYIPNSQIPNSQMIPIDTDGFDSYLQTEVNDHNRKDVVRVIAKLVSHQHHR